MKKAPAQTALGIKNGWLRNAVRAVRDFAYAKPEEQPREPARRLKIGVALGGGFARGIAHLGVLHALERSNIPIDYIAGTSAGALAGVAYASGLPFDKIVAEAAAIRFANFGQWRFSRMGIASNRRLASYPKEHLRVENFSDLRIPLAIVATDLLSGKAVSFTNGPLGLPLCASCAYPGLFRPIEYDGHVLVDGFVAAALPVEAVRKMGADIVIAVFLEAEELRAPSNIVDVIGRSFSIVRLQADTAWETKADVLIEPKVHEFAWDDFARTSELVAAGELAAQAAVPRIADLMRGLQQDVPRQKLRPMKSANS